MILCDEITQNARSSDFDCKKRNLVGRCYRGKKRARQSCRGTPFIKLYQIIFSIYQIIFSIFNFYDLIFNFQFLWFCIMRKKGEFITANLLGHVVPVEMVAKVGKSDRVLKAKMSYSFQSSILIQKQNGKVSYWGCKSSYLIISFLSREKPWWMRCDFLIQWSEGWLFPILDGHLQLGTYRNPNFQ